MGSAVSVKKYDLSIYLVCFDTRYAEAFKRAGQEVLRDWVWRRARRLLEEIQSMYPRSTTPLPDSLESELIESLSPIHVFNEFVDIHLSFENLDELQSMREKLLELASQNGCVLRGLMIWERDPQCEEDAKARGEPFFKVFLMCRKTIEFIDVYCPVPRKKLEHLKPFTSTSQQPQ